MRLSHEFTTTIHNLRAGAEFDDSEFLFTALGMPDGNVMCTHDADGKSISFYVNGTELVSTDQAQETELRAKADEVLTRRVEESRTRKPVTPATQPAGR
jgi:hypothetical protein